MCASVPSNILQSQKSLCDTQGVEALPEVVANWPKDALPNYDLILCSDVLYWSDVVPDLAAVLGRLLQNGKTTLLWCWVRSFPS